MFNREQTLAGSFLGYSNYSVLPCNRSSSLNNFIVCLRAILIVVLIVKEIQP